MSQPFPIAVNDVPISKIIHIDMDAFYASVEQHDNPELRGKPVVVGGSPESRGVVAAASYEARKFGIRSALPCSQAYRLCPSAVFVAPRMSRYREVSQAIHQIFRTYTDTIEPISLDEAYLDVTHNKQGLPYASAIARRIRQEILDTTGLTASAGVAPAKFLAKIASDIRKPNGQYVIPPEAVDAFVAQLPVGKIWGIGAQTQKRMHDLGVSTAGDLRKFSRPELGRIFGKAGERYYDLARGIDKRSVRARERKSIAVERTFAEDLLSVPEIEDALATIADKLSQLAKTPARTLVAKIRYSDFTTLTRSRTEPRIETSPASLLRLGQELLASTEAGHRPVRLLGLSLTNFVREVPAKVSQLTLDF